MWLCFKMTNLYQKSAIRLYEYGFGYMYPYPIVWRNFYSTITLSTCKRSLLCFKINLFLGFITSVASAYDVISWKIVDRPNYNIGFASLHLICSIIMSTPLLCCLTAYTNKEVWQGVNQLIQVTSQILKTGKNI